MAQQRVLQLPKFAVVEVMIDLDGRDQLNSEKWEVRDQFWRRVLHRLDELYPENQSEVRTVNHVKRTWCALKQRVLARAKTVNRETLPSDRKVLYLLKACDTYEEDAPVNLKRLEKLESATTGENTPSSNYTAMSAGDVTSLSTVSGILKEATGNSVINMSSEYSRCDSPTTMGFQGTPQVEVKEPSEERTLDSVSNTSRQGTPSHSSTQGTPVAKVPIPRTSVSLATKKLMIYQFENGATVSSLAKEYNISKSCVSKTLKRKSDILDIVSTRDDEDMKRVRRPVSEQLDCELLNFIDTCRHDNVHITGPILREKALEISHKLDIKDFKASEGWLSRFKIRHGIKFKQTATDNATDNYIEQLNDYLVDPEDDIANMTRQDERLEFDEFNQVPKNIDPLLDAMIVCGGRQALPKKRASTVNGKQEYRRFWDKVHMVLQFNTQCTGRSVLSFQRAWYNIRMHYSNKEKRGDGDRSFQARKAYYLMRILSQEQAKLNIDNGIVYDLLNPDDSQANGSRCEVIKQEPLDLTQLIMNGLNQQQQQYDEDIVEDDASSSVYDALNSNENGDLLTALSKSDAFPDESELRQKLLVCQIEREKAQTELLKAQKRLIEAQLNGVFNSEELPILRDSKSVMDNF
ncbi:unnamed protein product [Bursaphelenchus okinawaensis]|uniref:HTH CENPB-type domain-containing protein n=1 Tax=Bursaphelenchus okinawaensis TaxID=465554 RepID=A0A811JT04_9BILA|nr:unnamed protein product [Bursaphelenchus okinawaensis]CAG9081130.1 unnamed protein product [Bursaphelenchus okinawaensis]